MQRMDTACSAIKNKYLPWDSGQKVVFFFFFSFSIILLWRGVPYAWVLLLSDFPTNIQSISVGTVV